MGTRAQPVARDLGLRAGEWIRDDWSRGAGVGFGGGIVPDTGPRVQMSLSGREHGIFEERVAWSRSKPVTH